MPGRARPKGRPRFGRGGRVFTPPETLEYEARVREAAESVFAKPLEGDTLQAIIYVYVKGKNHADLDNYVKSILDGMNRVAYLDDKQIKDIHAYLRFVTDKADERVEVTMNE
ncbi:RusA family crossover junction endodeoxyribonuclease [Paenibacillus hexagrammi]|uniref:RusA family crossover junction endodeoxyribonuclease n=1 Tax=Paenibacillus hexagrammi TaxID=2908839 RepID=A0ABY3ST39_9BACL|nr:RusA family crossover junction endodeoxyribonuclease [Paenibacillus sp. YPD9-1]UJF36583.1 RusA family crossover junction endodeoxyribonuclease [Paenibacillus sp. YPD9-1]